MTEGPLGPPLLDEMKSVQLGRKDLIILSKLHDFPSLVQGLYVRALMECNEGGSSCWTAYRIAAITGAESGKPYSGFDAQGIETSWYLTIDFRGFSGVFQRTGDTIELSCISSECFTQTEYEEFVRSHMQNNICFPNIPHLKLHLANTIRRAMTDYSQLTAEEMSEVEREVKDNFVKYPFPSDCRNIQDDQLVRIIADVKLLSEQTRLAIEGLQNCRFCKQSKAVYYCDPCAHCVACEGCRHLIKDVCPVPGCKQQVSISFIPFRV